MTKTKTILLPEAYDIFREHGTKAGVFNKLAKLPDDEFLNNHNIDVAFVGSNKHLRDLFDEMFVQAQFSGGLQGKPDRMIAALNYVKRFQETPRTRTVIVRRGGVLTLLHDRKIDAVIANDICGTANNTNEAITCPICDDKVTSLENLYECTECHFKVCRKCNQEWLRTCIGEGRAKSCYQCRHKVEDAFLCYFDHDDNLVEKKHNRIRVFDQSGIVWSGTDDSTSHSDYDDDFVSNSDYPNFSTDTDYDNFLDIAYSDDNYEGSFHSCLLKVLEDGSGAVINYAVFNKTDGNNTVQCSHGNFDVTRRGRRIKFDTVPQRRVYNTFRNASSCFISITVLKECSDCNMKHVHPDESDDCWMFKDDEPLFKLVEQTSDGMVEHITDFLVEFAIHT